MFRFVPQRQRRVLTEPCRGGASALPTEDRLNRFSLPVGFPLYHRDKNPSIRKKFFRQREAAAKQSLRSFLCDKKEPKKRPKEDRLLLISGYRAEA